SVEYSPSGIVVNSSLQTSARHIYAAGAVLGKNNATHLALYESRIAAHNLLHKQKNAPDYSGSPRLTFSSPSVASVGLTEDDCLKRDLDVKIGFAPLNM